jgi:hypothetical protein
MITKKAALSTLIIVVIYVVITILMMNGELVKQTLFSNFPLDYKYNLLMALITGVSTSMTGLGIFLLLLTAILTGLNITLLSQKLSQLRTSGKMHLIVGGGSFIGIAGSGCATCGLPILSFLGLAGSVTFLPFHGTELSIFAIGMLLLSLFFMIKNSTKNNLCELKVNN